LKLRTDPGHDPATPQAPKVVITLPAFGAEHTLAKTVADIPGHLDAELILVDDASPDNTVQLARGMGIRVFVHRQNRGYGGNQKTCYQLALREGADIIVLLHPDYQYDPKAVPLLIAPILAGDADMSFGSRFAGLGDPRAGGMPAYRYVGNRVTTTLENLMLKARFTDMHSGLRAYTRRCLLSLPFLRYSDDFVFDSQLIIDAVTGGQRVVEVPIPTRYTKETSSISVVRSLGYVAGSLAYCGRQTAARGRRGRRSPVTFSTLRKGKQTASGPLVERACVLCGSRSQRLVHSASASGSPGADEFACTSDSLAEHDDIVQCSNCRLVSSVPKLSVTEILDRYAAVTDPTYLAEETSRRELFDWIIRRMATYHVSERRLLEIGSHIGLFLDVATRRGWAARGVEPSKWAVDLGRERFGVELSQGTIEELDEPPNSADAVVMLDVLEHLVDPLLGLRKIRSLIADEGLLTLTTVNLESLHSRARGAKWPWFIRPHLFYFTPETLHSLLLTSGFKMVEWSVVPRSFHLSYIATRGGSNLGQLGALTTKLSRIVDPKVPVGWLGDIIFVGARPR